MPNCSRCGNLEGVEYGNDGSPYCSSCMFYGMNKQCNRCRMYLPSTEMQTYRGQLNCTYCLADLRNEDTREERAKGSYEKSVKDSYSDRYSQDELCDRCRKNLAVAFMYNGRKLCESCVEREKKEWKDIGGERPPMAMLRIRADKGLAGRLVAAILRRINEVLGRKEKPDDKKAEAKKPGEKQESAKRKAELAGFKSTEQPENAIKEEKPAKKRNLKFVRYFKNKEEK